MQGNHGGCPYLGIPTLLLPAAHRSLWRGLGQSPSKKDIMAIRILHTADIHLGAPMTSFGGLAKSRKALLRETFLHVCRLALSKEADLFICAGDMFDSVRPEREDIACAREGFGILADAGLPAVAIPGGHDGAGIFQNVLETFKIPGLKILSPNNGQSGLLSLDLVKDRVNLYSLFPKPGTEANLDQMKRRRLDGFHVGILHASVFDQIITQVSYKDIPVTPKQLAALDLDYIALGHYHQFQIIEFEDKVIGVYPGTIESKRFSETGARHVALVILTEQGISIKKIEVGKTLVQNMELDIEPLADENAIVEKIKAAGGKGMLARITLKGLTDALLNQERIEKKAGSAFDYLNVIDQTEISGAADVRTIAGEPTVRGIAVGRLLRDLDNAVDPKEKRIINLALRLLVHQFELHRERG